MMGTFNYLVTFVFTLSLLSFIVLFGRVPALRKTPVGFLHRLLVHSLPHGLYALDRSLFGGYVKVRLKKTSDYLMKENHPIVLIFFLSLMLGGELIFLPAAWAEMPLRDRLGGSTAVVLPYILLFLCRAADPSIKPANYAEEMRRYPYDRVIYHPNQLCGTCRLLKPARSRHCSVCNVCVARHDHHCIWLMRCVGRRNYRYFLALLLSLGILTLYAVFVGFSILSSRLQVAFDQARSSVEIQLPWYTDGDLLTNIHRFAAAIGDDVRVGSVFLLTLMLAPLPFGLLAYHAYLIWAGTTTSETSKWEIWKDLIKERIAFKAYKSQVYFPPDPAIEPTMRWPVVSDQTLRCTDGGKHPRLGYLFNDLRYEIVQPADENAPKDGRWVKVRSMAEVINLYDMGVWNNLRDALGLDVD